MTPEELQEIFRECWTRETSGDPVGWSGINTAWMQCTVSALTAKDILGGKIVVGEAIVGKFHIYSPHYWNLLPDGREMDFTKEQFPESAVISKKGILNKFKNVYSKLPPPVRRKYVLFRLAVENQIRPNPLFSDEKYRLCFETAQASECQKMKFGCLVIYKNEVVAATTNKFIGPLKHLCKPECIRMKIQSRTESMIGACGHAEEWALQEIFKQRIDPSLCSLYIAGFDAKTNNPWIKKEAEHTCLRCAVQMYMAGIGKIWVPFNERWARVSAKDAVVKSAAYALKEKKV